jgi:outer membrane lipoprotein SlyB
MTLIIGIIAKENLLFGQKFIAEIGGAALLGGISASIGNRGNPCSTVTVAGFAAGRAAPWGVRVDASMTACMGYNLTDSNKFFV